MRLLATIAMGVLLGASGCSGCGGDSATPDAGIDGAGTNTFDECDGDAASFVRQAFLALDGRRPKSQAEVNVYVDLYTSAAALGDDPRDVVARAIMNRPEFADRWTDVVMDALHVQRLDVQTEASCWDETVRATVTPELATAVRDQRASVAVAGGTFTMLDLAKSALMLDDLTPIYRAQIFSMVSHPIPAANVPPIEAELARREDFGGTFDASYLHRDVVCLGCHTSSMSVTDSDDPEFDRHWPVPGAAELAVYGNANGISSERAHAAFRVDDFVDAGTTRPWSWSSRCGSFAAPSSVRDDIADVDGKLASLTGKRSTVYDLEAALARGFTALRGTALPGDAAITDPDTALAWLVTLKITEDIWKQATGTSLTIANYFPRNEAASQQLYSLATTFAKSGFSLKALLAAIVASDYFNRQPAEAGCGESPYIYPSVFDPWVIADADEARRKNGPGDAITAVDARTLIAATSAALEWAPAPGGQRFPDFGEGCEQSTTCAQLNGFCQGQFNACCQTYQNVCVMKGVFPSTEIPFQLGIGTFLRNSERGFRGLDFQARLAWEDRYGGCARPAWVTQDFIDRLVASAAADPTALANDLVAALKDRLTGEPAMGEGAERDALAAIVGALDAPAAGVTADKLRQVCGALLESPQFLLQGMGGRGGDVPKLTPAAAGYDAVCADLAATGIGVAGRAVTCGPALALAVARTQPAPVVVAPHVLREPPLRKRLPPLREPAPTRRPTGM